MSRYIDADKLWNDRPQLIGGESLGFKAGFSECMWGFSKRIKEQISHPTADVVEVVRCKDCVCADTLPSGLFRCQKHSVYSMFGNSIFNVKPEDFCSYGERRTDDGT